MRELNAEQWKLFFELTDELESLAPADRAARLDELEGADHDVIDLLKVHARLPESTSVSIQVPGLELKHELGRGGMGVTYEAHDLSLDRPVALKILPAQLCADTEARERFRREALAGARVRHPGIVPVYSADEVDGVPYIVQELVEGGRTLEDRIRELRDQVGLPADHFRRVATSIAEIAGAMQAVHEAGIVHRDLKPANVLVTKSGTTKVADFGIAALRDAPGLTRTGRVVGSPYYMSPEQAAGTDDVDARSDVFSLGVMLYELLCLVRPFEGGTSQQIIARVTLDDPIRPRAILPRVPRDLETICLKALAKSPADRYASMRELGADVKRFLADEPIQARPASWSSRSIKWMRRHPGRSVGAVLSVTAFMAGSVLTQWGLRASALAKERRAQISILSAQRDLSALRTEAQLLWPADPRIIEASEEWLRKAKELLARIEDRSDEASCASQLARLRSRRYRDVSAPDGPEWRFLDPDGELLHEELSKVEAAVAAFRDPDTGLMAGTYAKDGWGVERRLHWAQSLAERTVRGAHVEPLWTEALKRIAANPTYLNFEMSPQVGLVPIGPDPVTQLEEFWHPQTGDQPERDANGRLVDAPESGVVLILVPGGQFLMGAAPDDTARMANSVGQDESPHFVRVDAFLVSKFELTRMQWEHLAGADPSHPEKADPRAPVNQVSWDQCVAVLWRGGLDLPAEAQWELMARAGAEGPWFGARSELCKFANILDLTHKERPRSEEFGRHEGCRDGFTGIAPVGSLEPNAFGVHDVLGNVFELCRDDYDADYGLRSNTGVAQNPLVDNGGDFKVVRGGGFLSVASYARLSERQQLKRDEGRSTLGVRPIWEIRTGAADGR